MKRLYTIIQLLLIIATVGITFQSCIKEDLTGCLSNVRVYFDYEPNTYAPIKEGINPENVTRINLYVFDAKGLFLGEYVDENPVIKDENYHMLIPKLIPGSYRFVAWGSLSDQHRLTPLTPVVGETSFEDFQLHLNVITKDNKVDTNLTPLFFGTITSVTIKNNDLSPELRIRLIQDTYTINVTAKGQISPTAPYTMSIEDDNAQYKFDNSFVSSPSFNYVTQSKRLSTSEITGSLSLMRIDNDRSPKLKIQEVNSGQPVFSGDLVKMILEIQEVHGIEIDFSRMHEFDIEITIKNDGGFIISINNWTVVFDETDLGRIR